MAQQDHTWGRTIGRRVGVVALALLAWAACGAPEPEGTSGIGGGARLLMEVTLDPAWAGPGDTVILRLVVPEASGLQESAWVNYEGGNLEVPLVRADTGWTGEVALEAPTRLADHRVDVRAYYEGGEAVGYALLAVSDQPACPEGEVRQAGDCHPVFAGGTLTSNRRLIRMNRHGESRTMAHPRAIYRVEDKLIGCITDSMAVMRLDELAPLDDPLLVDGHDFTGQTPAWMVPYAETMLKDGGLAHCNHMVFDESRGIAMVASRGNLAGPGGMMTWRYPSLDSDVLLPPEPLSVWETEEGFERLAWDGVHLYGTQHPDQLVVMTIDDDGGITEVGRAELGGSLAAWAVAIDGDVVYVTDAGDHQVAANAQVMHDGEEHTAVAMSGRVYAVDVSDPLAPIVLGWTSTAGLGKGLAVIGDGVVAVGGGADGVELLDLSNPRKPVHLHVYPTPGLAHGVTYADGLLIAAAWDSVVLFDASERGVLRQIDIEGFVRPHLPPSFSSQGSYGGLFGAGYVHLDGDLLIVNEWNNILVATVTRGGHAPRAMLGQRSLITHAGRSTPQSFALRVYNGGREALWVEGVESEAIQFLQSGQVVPPGGYGDVALQVQPSLEESTYFVLETNDPDGQERGVHVSLMPDNYAPGDEAPPFRVPSINHCDTAGTGELCDMAPVCFDSRDPLSAGRPLLIAFFSSW